LGIKTISSIALYLVNRSASYHCDFREKYYHF